MEVLIFIGGLLLGFVVAAFIFKPKSIGTLKIVKTEEEAPYLFLDLDEEIDQFYNKQYVNMKVSHK